MNIVEDRTLGVFVSAAIVCLLATVLALFQHCSENCELFGYVHERA